MVDKMLYEQDVNEELTEASYAKRAVPRQRDARQHYTTRYTRRRRNGSGIHRRRNERTSR